MRFLSSLLALFLLLLLLCRRVEGFQICKDLSHHHYHWKSGRDPTHYNLYSPSLSSSSLLFGRKDTKTSNNRFSLPQNPVDHLSLWNDNGLPATNSIATTVTADRQQRPRNQRLPSLFQEQDLRQRRNLFFTRRPSRRKFAMSALLVSSDFSDDIQSGSNDGDSSNLNNNLNNNENGKNEENDDNDTNQSRNRSSKKKSWSVARMGGRQKKDGAKPSKKESTKPPSLPGGIVGILAMLMLAIGLSGLFGSNNGGDNPNYYYYSYQSSVYETRTYNDNGQLEDTSRKETSEIKSNIPGLSSSLPSSSAVSSLTGSDTRQQDEVLLLEQQEKRFDQLLDSIIQESMPQKSDFFW